MKKINNESIYSILKTSCEKYKNDIAFTCGKKKIKYFKFLKKVDESAASFEKLGVKSGDIITFIVPNTIECMICIYALNKIGAICNIMHPLSSDEEIKKSIKETSSKVIITYEYKIDFINKLSLSFDIKNIIHISSFDFLTTLDKIKYTFKKSKYILSKTINFNRFKFLGKSFKLLKKYKCNEDCIIINSNSKKIVLTNNNINSYAFNYLDSLKDKFINNNIFTDLSIINVIPIYHRALLVGQNIIIDTKNTVQSNLTNIIKYKPNILEISPTTLEQMCLSKKFNNEDLSYIKLIICGKERLNKELYNKLIKYLHNHNSNADILVTYGMIETTSNICISDYNDIENVGNSIKDTLIKIIKIEDENECKVNETGRICISGPCIMNKYFNNDILTNKILKNDSDGKIWLYSDDVGFLDNENKLHFKSNIKRVIVSSGIEIYPEELESTIKAHWYVKDVSVIGFPHPYKKEVVKAYIVLKDKIIINSEIKKSIKDYCEKNIPKYALPYAYAYRKELPKTSIGKVSYQSLINNKNEEE